jgi:enamine deaminase RidA (YjgF/YER057c/UK114 family)
MSLERYGVIDEPGRPRICLGLAQGDWFTVCTTARDRSADIKGQIFQVLAAFDGYLTEASCGKSRLLTAQIWLKRMSDFDVMTEIWNNWIDRENPPTFSCLRADMSTEEALVEIRISAARLRGEGVNQRNGSRPNVLRL